MTLYDYDTQKSPVGELTWIASDKGIRALLWPGARPEKARRFRNPWIARAREQLEEYFAGRRRGFDVLLDLEGTPFQLKAWRALREIPYGETISYGEQARRLGDRKLARAVGAANGQNPVSILVPCHRVVAGNGALTGFAGGLETKRFLLDLEQGIKS